MRRSFCGPLPAAARTAGMTAASVRSAKASSRKDWRSGLHWRNSAASASVTSRPGSSRAVRRPMPNRALSGERSCSSSRGQAGGLPGEDRPADGFELSAAWARSPRAPCHTASRLQRRLPWAMNHSAQRMQPSATAGRTASGAAARDWVSALAALAPPMRPSATAAAEATSGSGVLELLDEAADGLRVTAHADGVDDPDEQLALQLVHGVAQSGVGGGAGDGLQGDARPRGKLRVGQQGRQGGDGVFGAVDGQLLAGEGLLGRRGVGLEEADQRALLLGGGSLGLSAAAARAGLAARTRDSDSDTRGQKCSVGRTATESWAS